MLKEQKLDEQWYLYPTDECNDNIIALFYCLFHQMYVCNQQKLKQSVSSMIQKISIQNQSEYEALTDSKKILQQFMKKLSFNCQNFTNIFKSQKISVLELCALIRIFISKSLPSQPSKKMRISTNILFQKICQELNLKLERSNQQKYQIVIQEGFKQFSIIQIQITNQQNQKILKCYFKQEADINTSFVKSKIVIQKQSDSSLLKNNHVKRQQQDKIRGSNDFKKSLKRTNSVQIQQLSQDDYDSEHFHLKQTDNYFKNSKQKQKQQQSFNKTNERTPPIKSFQNNDKKNQSKLKNTAQTNKQTRSQQIRRYCYCGQHQNQLRFEKLYTMRYKIT